RKSAAQNLGEEAPLSEGAMDEVHALADISQQVEAMQAKLANIVTTETNTLAAKFATITDSNEQIAFISDFGHLDDQSEVWDVINTSYSPDRSLNLPARMG